MAEILQGSGYRSLESVLCKVYVTCLSAMLLFVINAYVDGLAIIRIRASDIYGGILINRGGDEMANIRIYSTTWCQYCKAEMAYLDQKGIKYEDILVDKDPSKAREMVELSGQM